MEGIILEELGRDRGLRKTLKAAYSAFLVNFQRIFRHLWWAALALALLLPLFMLIRQDSYTAITSNWWLLPLFMVTVAADIVYGSRVAMLLNDKPWTWNLQRMSKLLVWSFVVSFLASFLLMAVWMGAYFIFKPAEGQPVSDPQIGMQQIALASQKILAVVGAFSLVMGALLLPYVYAFTKYVVDVKSTLLEISGKAYGQGIRHWGYIFRTMLMSGLFLLLFSMVACLPMAILAIALTRSNAGVAVGDPSGIPANFSLLVYVVFAATYFVLLLAEVFLVFVSYYMYGTIETRRQEREKARQQKLTEEGV